VFVIEPRIFKPDPPSSYYKSVGNIGQEVSSRITLGALFLSDLILRLDITIDSDLIKFLIDGHEPSAYIFAVSAISIRNWAIKH
jgi:hypothetical protein